MSAQTIAALLLAGFVAGAIWTWPLAHRRRQALLHAAREKDAEVTSVVEDVIRRLVMLRVIKQQEALETFALSGCFVEDLWIIQRSFVPDKWEIGVGSPLWRIQYEHV